MNHRIAAAALVLAALVVAAGARAHQPAPRDMWPNAVAAAREGDFDTANKRTAELLGTDKTLGIRAFPLYGVAAEGLARETEKQKPDLATWASTTARKLDPRSPALAFAEADRRAANVAWSRALPLAFQGFARVFGDYRTNTLSRADLVLVAAAAIAITAIVFAIALFIRYGRSMAHDFREILSTRFHGGSVSVLAFALLFLPIFLWLGPMWLIFYWMAILFGYAGVVERIAIVVLLILVALAPIMTAATASRIAGVDSPVLQAAISSSRQSYHPEALRRLQELNSVVPNNATVHLLLGNLQTFEGANDQAEVHYRRAIELRRDYAGAFVNLGNLHFLDNDFQPAMTQYERAEQLDPELAIAYFNHSVAAGDTFKFDLQKTMIGRARDVDRSLVERFTRNPPPQKIVLYHPPLSDAWEVTEEVARNKAARALFGNYSTFDPLRAGLNSITIGALVALVLAVALWAFRRRTGFANACIKCGRTFCPRCKSARESTTYCTQCIHIYLKRDGVSLDTKRQKLEEVGDYQTAVTRRNRAFATFLPGSAQMLEGRVTRGILGLFFFALFVAIAVFVGRLAPALGPVAEVAQMIVRVGAIAVAVIIWFLMSFPVYRRRSAS